MAARRIAKPWEEGGVDKDLPEIKVDGELGKEEVESPKKSEILDGGVETWVVAVREGVETISGMTRRTGVEGASVRL